ncbi:seryl-tRNA synthetase [Mycotypha africana]|uniref:seryl-tRNA synthetase n=1 Tax=Mycotypha africana TaxID=64632 RepID=UPI0023008E3B|nr:seryl-tRNA synthetase [Mycotypha africana]KAI8970057.1 seryl-tRNA synthetase [Mycotypha africana]
MFNRKSAGDVDLDRLCQLRHDLKRDHRLLLDLRAQHNKQSALLRSLKSDSNNSNEQEAQKAKSRELKNKIKTLEQSYYQRERELLNQALMIPNDSHPSSPIGPEKNAHVMKIVGSPRMNEERTDHVDIAKTLGILDLEQAASSSGSSFYYLQGMGAFLELALIQYAMQKAYCKGFFSVMTPDIVRTPLAYRCGFQPRKEESSHIYHLKRDEDDKGEEEGLCLVGTAEIPLAGKFASKLLQERELPQRLVGFGHAFRREAGGHGSEPRGLYRVHQFSKVELFAVTTPEQSEPMMEEIRSLQEEMFTELGLCFRVMDMPTEELGASAYRKYDMEAWMPGRQQWGEISSTSNCTDYQARRLSIRYKPRFSQTKKGNTDFCHTLNGTAIAVPRVIIAILETFVQEDGSVQIPKVLRKWIPGEPEFITALNKR